MNFRAFQGGGGRNTICIPAETLRCMGAHRQYFVTTTKKGSKFTKIRAFSFVSTRPSEDLLTLREMPQNLRHNSFDWKRAERSCQGRAGSGITCSSIFIDEQARPPLCVRLAGQGRLTKLRHPDRPHASRFRKGRPRSPVGPRSASLPAGNLK